jgi:branched-chain amino acid transport system substrate-binding protein
MRRLTVLILMTVMVAAMLAGGCAKPAPAPTPASAPSKTLDIGIVTPLTGPFAFIGNNIQNGLLMAIDDQNKQGGITISGQKYTINPIIRDSKNDLVLGKSTAEELIFDKEVKVIAGPFVFDAIGVQPVTESNKVMTFLLQPSNIQMISPDKPYTFFFGSIPEQMYVNPAAYVQKFYPEAKTVLSISPDIPSFPMFLAAINTVLPQYGFEWLGVEKFPVSAKDLMPVISRSLAKNPDIIDACCTGGMSGLGTLLPKQLREAGFNGPIIMPAAPSKGSLEEVVPKQLLTAIVLSDYNIDSPIVSEAHRELYNRAKERYQQIPDPLLLYPYNSVKAFFEFLNGQDTLDTTVWRDSFAKYHWQGIYGFENFWLGKKAWGIDRRVLVSNWVAEYKDGKLANEFSAPLPYELFVEE